MGVQIALNTSRFAGIQFVFELDLHQLPQQSQPIVATQGTEAFFNRKWLAALQAVSNRSTALSSEPDFKLPVW